MWWYPSKYQTTDEDDDLTPLGLFFILVAVFTYLPYIFLRDLFVRPFRPLNATWPRTSVGTPPWLGAEGGSIMKRASRQ